ncbi:MAG TPA: hypothetical protein VLK58_11280 [Conexibacter sp.]|nr:hypothetical protein [Conexibacter sp.]
MIESNDIPTLRVLPGGRRDERAGEPRGSERGTGFGGGAGSDLGAALDECVVSRAAIRAGDRHEPWTLPAGDALHALADAAATAGVEFELAVRLCVERALVREDLRAAGADVARLDALAAAAVVAAPVDAADCAYLRRLTRREPAPQRRTLGDAVIVGLPARLSARLLAALPALTGEEPDGAAAAALDDLLADANADVASALAWEIAAVLDGRTISEWAPLAAMRALAAAPSA